MRSLFRCLGLAAIPFAIAACNPPRQGFLDVASDTGRADAGADIATDGDIDGDDTGACESLECNDQCIANGYALGGACRATDMTCNCFGERDGGGDDVVDDGAAMSDAPPESGVIRCTSNDGCPPTTFCSGAGCDTPGFCYPRGEMDPASCGTEGPPSCGCDGLWYANTCARLSTGVRLNPTPGACGPVPTDGGP
jgi:hypothetical protein